MRIFNKIFILVVLVTILSECYSRTYKYECQKKFKKGCPDPTKCGKPRVFKEIIKEIVDEETDYNTKPPFYDGDDKSCNICNINDGNDNEKHDNKEFDEIGLEQQLRNERLLREERERAQKCESMVRTIYDKYCDRRPPRPRPRVKRIYPLKPRRTRKSRMRYPDKIYVDHSINTIDKCPDVVETREETPEVETQDFCLDLKPYRENIPIDTENAEYELYADENESTESNKKGTPWKNDLIRFRFEPMPL